MVKLTVRDRESIQEAVRRFRKLVANRSNSDAVMVFPPNLDRYFLFRRGGAIYPLGFAAMIGLPFLSRRGRSGSNSGSMNFWPIYRSRKSGPVSQAGKVTASNARARKRARFFMSAMLSAAARFDQVIPRYGDRDPYRSFQGPFG